MILALTTLHEVGIFIGMGGRSGLGSPWPMAVHDHAIQEHNAWVTRPMLKATGMTAGYDPYFMGGYAKSLLSSPSSTLFEVLSFAMPGGMEARGYKVTILVILAALPWLILAAARGFQFSEPICAWSVTLFLLFVWTDGAGGGYPLGYAGLGMSAYLLSIPLALTSTAAFVAFLRHGGLLRWISVAILGSVTLLVHVTVPLILIPAGLAAIVAASRSNTQVGANRILAALMLPLVAALVNAFWWYPALVLKSTSLPEKAFFANAEPVWERLREIVWSQSPIQAVLVALGLVGLRALWKRETVAAAALAGFALSGFCLGYLAGGFRRLDVLQPGRQTYAFYVATTILSGVGLADLGRAIGQQSGRGARRIAMVALAILGVRLFGSYLNILIPLRLGLSAATPRPFLTSEPPPGLELISGWVKANMKPGERLFYEEVGIAQKGDPAPLGPGRYSGLLPQLTGVEVIGGFYLHTAVKTNFTQIGEGKLFGKPWGREQFRRYAAIYRPSAIVCWSNAARKFCAENPDLVKMDRSEGALLLGHVLGFEGATIRGRAEVKSEPGRLRVTKMAPDLDGLVVLRYHHAPGLRCTLPATLEAVFLEEDPVPFVAIRPGPGQSDALVDWSAFPGR